jgi:trigger factor
MSVQVENLDKNMAKLTIEVSAEEFDNAVEKVYLKQKNRINIPGFRKGKAPRKMIEKMYGAGIFYEDAANSIIPDAYEDAAKESGLEIVSQPDISVTQIEAGKPFIFAAKVAVKPEVTLGDYKGIEVGKVITEVTEEDLQAELDKIREQQSRVVSVEDKAAENGDIVVIDFEGFQDGVAFEGGKGEDYPLTLGSHSFIDTFEDQLIGKKAGDEAEVNVTFPEEYQEESLAGKPATFQVKVKEVKVKELPELDDDFAQDVSEFDTLEEYKEDVKKQLLERREKTARDAKEDAVIEKIIENAQMEIPEAMVRTQMNQMANDFAQRIQSQGISMEQYFQFTGLDNAKFGEQIRPQALKRIQSRLVLEAIAKAENIEVSEDELNKEIENMAATYQMETDKVREMIGDEYKESMKLDIAVQKAIDLVVEASVEKED